MMEDIDRRRRLLDAGIDAPAIPTPVALVMPQPAVLALAQEVVHQCRGVDIRLATTQVADLAALPGRMWVRLAICDPVSALEVRAMLRPDQRVVVLARGGTTRVYPGSLVLDMDTPGWSTALAALLRAARPDSAPPAERRRAAASPGHGRWTALLQHAEALTAPESGLGTASAFRRALGTLPHLDQPAVLILLGVRRAAQQAGSTALVLQVLRSAMRGEDALFRLGDHIVVALLPATDPAAIPGLLTRLSWRLSPSNPAALATGHAVWNPGEDVDAVVAAARAALFAALGIPTEPSGSDAHVPVSEQRPETSGAAASPAEREAERGQDRQVGARVVQPWVSRPRAFASEHALVVAAEVQEEEEFGHAGHGTGVARVAAGLVGAMDWPADQADLLRRAALLHDAGKIALDRALWGSRSPLSSWQRRLMEAHATLGSELADSVGMGEAVITAILHHHERWDGGGYPARLAGEAIPTMARVLFVAEATDSMLRASYRRPPLAPARVAEVLESGAGRLWDPRLARQAARMVGGTA